MKFNRNYYNKRDIFQPGVLSQLTDDVLSGVPLSNIKRLTTDEMNRIPEIYASIDYAPSDLELNENAHTLLDVIEDDKVYKTYNKKEILGKDIKSITLLMYLRPRTAYWKPDKPQIHDTSVCGAVSLPLLGFKRYRGIPYQDWNYYVNKIGGLGSDILDLVYDEGEFHLLESEDAGWRIEQFFALDLLLGKTLASTTYDEGSDTINWSKDFGLLLLSLLHQDKWRPDYKDIQHFRAYNMGNHKGSYASNYNTAKIKEDENPLVLLHNRCSTPMRLMLSQRWAWYGYHRNTDMICDFQDWDNMPKSVDNMSVAMEGLDPKDIPLTRIKERFGISTTTSASSTSAPIAAEGGEGAG